MLRLVSLFWDSLTDSLWRCIFYSWICTAGLDEFLKFFWKISCACVLAVVRRNPLTSDPTDQEIETRITKWLPNAPDRNSGGKRTNEKEVMHLWMLKGYAKLFSDIALILLLFEQMLLLFKEKLVFTNFSVWTEKDRSNAKFLLFFKKSCTIYVPVMFQFTVQCFF